LERTFTAHFQEVKLAGSDIGNWLVTGFLAMTAAATGTLTCGFAAFVGVNLRFGGKRCRWKNQVQD
jgi:hypothetical protein